MNEKLKLDNIDYIKGKQVDLNEPHEANEIAPVEQIRPAVLNGESGQDAAEKQREEKVDLLMQNVKEFIRNIDVKAL